MGGWLGAFVGLPPAEQADRADVVSMFIGAAALLVSIVALLLAAAQLWQGRRNARADRPTPHLDRDQAALDRLRTHLGHQTRLPRIGDPASRGLALRVHPAIPLPDPPAGAPARSRRRRLLPRRWQRGAVDTGGLDPDLPLFVDRERGPKVAAWTRAAASSGGFLVLVGDSSVGKTRLLYETARRELADFHVLAPDPGDGDLVNTLAQTSFNLRKLIVWLDELHRYLDGPYLEPGATPITAGTLRRLLETRTAVVLLGTLWPEHANQLRATIPGPAGGQPQPRYPGAVDVLDHPRCHQLPLGTFSPAERTEAVRLAGQDPRLAEALAYYGETDERFNVTETLAGAPELMRRYEEATAEQGAVLCAAIDARRVGVQAPLTHDLLKAAARGYLDRVHPDDDWFPVALTELTRIDRATAPLLELPNLDHTAVVGYTVADYLLQHASTQRRYKRLRAATWDALAAHTHNVGDLRRLADSAAARLLYCYAEPLLRRSADAGDRWAGDRLADLLRAQGRKEEALVVLRARADAGDAEATDQLAYLLARQGREEEALVVLRARADAGYDWAAERLADLLQAQGREEELRARADTGDDQAARRLADLLRAQGREEEALVVLRAHADAGDAEAAARLADLLVGQGVVVGLPDDVVVDLDRPGEPAPPPVGAQDRPGRERVGREEEAVAVLRAHAADDREAAERLADLLKAQGREEEALAVLRAYLDHHYAWTVAARLADLLAEQGLEEELRARADTGDREAAERLVDLLQAQGREEELRARADTGDGEAAERLIDLLQAQGREEEAVVVLRAHAADRYVWTAAAERLADLLKAQGRDEELLAILRAGADAGDRPTARRLADLLQKQGREEELRARADTGDGLAAGRLVDLLQKQGKVEEALVVLRTHANAGDRGAAERLVDLLKEQGLEEELRARADTGDGLAAGRLVDLLQEQGRVEEALVVLRTHANAGVRGAAEGLAGLLQKQGKVGEALAVLRAEVDAGRPGAAESLIKLLIKQGKADQARRLGRFGLNPDGSIADAPYWDRGPRQG